MASTGVRPLPGCTSCRRRWRPRRRSSDSERRMASRSACAGPRAGGVEHRIPHVRRVVDLALHDIEKRLARGRLDDGAYQRPTVARVLVPGAGSEEQGIVSEERQPVERALAVIAHIQDFFVVLEVAHAGDMTHQLTRRDGPLLFGEAGHVVAHRRVEVEQTTLVEQADRRGGHRLCHAPDTEQGLRRHRAPFVDVGPAEALGPHDLSGHAHGERQAGEVLLDHEGADERASPIDGVGVLGCRGLVDLGVHRRGVVAVYIGVTGTPRVDYPAYRSAGGEQRCGQHEDRGWRKRKEAAETTRCTIHAMNFSIQSYMPTSTISQPTHTRASRFWKK